jgi:hypothetical protein
VKLVEKYCPERQTCSVWKIIEHPKYAGLERVHGTVDKWS